MSVRTTIAPDRKKIAVVSIQVSHGKVAIDGFDRKM
jgi:hypothetical protein